MLAPKLLLQGRKSEKYMYTEVKYDEYLTIDSETGVHSPDSGDIVYGKMKTYEYQDVDFVTPYKSTIDFLVDKNIIDRPAIAAKSVPLGPLKKTMALQIGATVANAMLNDYKLLIEMLDCAASFADNKTLSTDRIIGACKKHGLLIYAQDGEINMYGIAHKAAIYNVDDFAPLSFHVPVLIERLSELYDIYLLWTYLYWNDRGALQKSSAWDRHGTNESEETILFAVLDSIPRINIQRQVEIENNKARPLFHAACLLDALILQMTDLLIAGEPWVDGHSVHNCNRCGQVFVRRRGNATLCENCRTNAEKVRAHRMKKKMEKEAQTDAEKTRKQ